MPEQKKQLCVLSGPSGAGKNTVYDALCKRLPELAHTVSATTRAPRDGEADGVDYYFLTKEEFLRRMDADEFIEYVEYGGNYYGTLKSEVERLTALGKTVVLIIEVNGALRIKTLFPEAATVFIIPPSLKVLRQRLRDRGQNTGRELEARLKIAKAELKKRSEYDYCVVNDEIDRCVDEIYAIIKGDDPK